MRPLLLPALAPWLLWAIASTAPSSQTTLQTASAETSTSEPAVLTPSAVITIPVRPASLSMADFVVHFTDASGNAVGAVIDYLEPQVVLLNGYDLLNCSEWLLVYDAYSYASLPLTFVSDSHTYNLNACYEDGAYQVQTTATVTLALHVYTTTADVSYPTTEPYSMTWANGVYANGYVMDGNLTIDSLEDTLQLDNIGFVLANDTNTLLGALGLSSSFGEDGFLDYMKRNNSILSSSYSIFYFEQSSSDDISGYLLLGAVDQKLYTGELYAYTCLPHTGWGDSFASLPIVSLDLVQLENLDSGSSVYLYNTDALPIVMDPTLYYTYLPWEFLINLALQTNAYYSLELSSWIVKCQDVEDSNAVFKLAFGPLTIEVPLSSIMESDTNTNLTFTDGSSACFLNIFPSDFLGYPAFGSGFLRYFYMAMDNDDGIVALANANHDFSTAQASASVNGTATVGWIYSGLIPFATLVLASLDLTFTFSSSNATSSQSVPARLTDVQIASGNIVFTNGAALSSTSSTPASAAEGLSTSAGAERIVAPSIGRNGFTFYVTVVVGALLGISIL